MFTVCQVYSLSGSLNFQLSGKNSFIPLCFFNFFVRSSTKYFSFYNSLQIHTHIKVKRKFQDNYPLLHVIYWDSFYSILLLSIIFIRIPCESLNGFQDAVMGCSQQFENHCLRWQLENQSSRPQPENPQIQKAENWTDVGWFHRIMWKQKHKKSVQWWEIAEAKFLVGDLLASWSRNHHS